jgi:hypothetical protein
MKAQFNIAAVAELDCELISAIVVSEMTRLLNGINEDGGVLPTERTVAMKQPEVTRAISAEIFGRLAIGTWLRTL